MTRDHHPNDAGRYSRGALEELADPRFKLIRLAKNVGQTGATRRVGR